MPFTSARREALSDHERLWQWKLILRIILVVFAIISIGLFGYILGVLRLRTNYYSLGVLASTDLWCIAEMAFATIFAVIYILYLVLKKKTVHPGWCVAIDLITWLSLVVAAGAAITEGVYSVSSSVYNSCETTYSSSSGHQTYNCDKRPAAPSHSKLRTLANSQLVGGIFAMIVGLLAFTLFVWACVDTHRHNARKRDVMVTQMTTPVIDDMRQRGQIPADYNPMRQQQHQHQQPLVYSSQPAMMSGGRDVEQGNGMYNHPTPPQGPPQILRPSHQVPMEMSSPGLQPVYR